MKQGMRLRQELLAWPTTWLGIMAQRSIIPVLVSFIMVILTSFFNWLA
jgi:hypothetical protein